MKRFPGLVCARSFATATGEVGGYDPERDSEYDHVFCGLPSGHTGVHVAMIWFFDEDSVTSPPSPAPTAHEREREIAACLSA